MEQVARETDAHIDGSLSSDAFSSASRPAATYLEVMDHNIRLISAVLRASKDKASD